MPSNVPDRYASQREHGRIYARILDAGTGLTELDRIFAIRIHSRNLNTLIMNDYVPTLGRVEGDVVFLGPEGEYPYHNIRGFYKLQHNEFTLLVEEYMKKGEAG